MGVGRYLQLSFSFRGCRVSVSFYFFALLCAAAFLDRSGVMLWGLLAALLHECGHLAVMLLIPGHSPREINVTPFGMRIENSPLAEFAGGNNLVLFAGSGVNFICTAVTFGFLPEFAAVSFVLGVLNLLPVKGMDGGGILLRLLERRMRESSALIMSDIISWVTLCILAACGIYILAVTRYNFTLLCAAAALAIAGIKEKPQW